ncbi:uncharacterized protein FFC1_11669 [Fusarium fujikuroi]|nr:uncharacterized protein FFC1_11669 [Fusarium fujikuroi]
MPSDLPFEDF